MPKSRRYSNKYRSRRYKRTKRGGENTNTDTLDRMEQGRKYGENTNVPPLLDPNTINMSMNISDQSQKQDANAFFNEVSKGMEEQTKLEQKYAEDMKKAQELENWKKSLQNPVSAAEFFNTGGRRRTKRRKARKHRRTRKY